ncbi:MAG TPA: metallophosphoesterase family protein [Methanotrichaceae archaeon]|nr:metallophosphoesterase family protein [Methanotrichaceae archaeon]
MRKYLVGVISDTHGLIRPEALEAFKGSDLIIHAGDIGRPQVLDALETIAPTVAVRGNNDRGKWADKLNYTESVEVGEARIYVLHRISDLHIDPTTSGYDAVIFGHSHRASIRDRDGVMFLNPGYSGQNRFRRQISIAMLSAEGVSLEAKIIRLDI